MGGGHRPDREDIVTDIGGGARGGGCVGIKISHKEGMDVGRYVVAGLVEEVKRVSVGRFEIGTMFRGEVYSEDIEVMGLANGSTLNFDGEAAWVGPVAHGGVGEKVVGDENSNSAGM